MLVKTALQTFIRHIQLSVDGNHVEYVNSFYRAACMQRGPSDRKSVCPSVRLSVRPSVRPSVCHGVNCDETTAPSEKSSIMTNRKSPTTLPMSLR